MDAQRDALWLALFLVSTPVTVAAVFFCGRDRLWWAVANSYAFSIGMVGLYFWPLLTPFWASRDSGYDFRGRLHAATMNWLVWLTVMTEMVFMVPHTVGAGILYRLRGSPVEWPFWSYGLSDDRWNNYHEGAGLKPEVQIINWNDSSLGFLVALALLWRYRNPGCGDTGTWAANVILVLTALFRDATLWRETVEYMVDHHRKGYPHTVGSPYCVHEASVAASEYRPHAIACLWLVNVLWLIAPVLTVVWGWHQLVEAGAAMGPRRPSVKRA